ncbi:MAG: SURF1 family protein [Hyphomicrobiales bacterium]
MIRSSRPRLWPVLLASGIGLAILLSLGVWQVQRLAWKEALIHHLDERMTAPPRALADVLAAPDADYTPVTVSGHFMVHPPFRLLTSVKGRPGWLLVQGFATAEGKSLLVARGGIPEDADLPPAPQGELTLTGILRQHPGKPGFFDGANDVAGNSWTWWDTAGMLQALGATEPPDEGVVLHLLPGTAATEGLAVEAPKADLRNNHLGYAITWFGLAAALVAVTAAFLWRRGKQS